MRLSYKTLATRVARLEGRRKFQRRRPCIVFTVYDIPEAHIVGMAAPSGPVTERQTGESLAALASRHAGAAGSTRIGLAVYEAGALDFVAQQVA